MMRERRVLRRAAVLAETTDAGVARWAPSLTHLGALAAGARPRQASAHLSEHHAGCRRMSRLSDLH